MTSGRRYHRAGRGVLIGSDGFIGKARTRHGAGVGAATTLKLRSEGANAAVADRDMNGIETKAHQPGDSADAWSCHKVSDAITAPSLALAKVGDGIRIAQPKYRRRPVLCSKNSCTLLRQMPPSNCQIRMYIHTARLIRAVQRYLRVFEAAARHGSFTLTGDELDLTQSAVSRQIKDLESKLGRKLFQQQHKQIKLNETGEKPFRAYSFAARLTLL